MDFMKKICFAVYFYFVPTSSILQRICNLQCTCKKPALLNTFKFHSTQDSHRKEKVKKEMFIQLISTYLIFSICTTLIQFLEENNFFNKFYLPACLSNNVLRT